MITIPIKICGGVLPKYQTEHSAGLDLAAAVTEPVILTPMSSALIPTGMMIELPVGYEAQIRPRSGLALKHNIIIPNSPGTIDADYRGEIKVILMNLGKNDFTINRGDRIAQMVIAKVERAEFTLNDSLAESKRGAGGFGHTGV